MASEGKNVNREPQQVRSLSYRLGADCRLKIWAVPIRHLLGIINTFCSVAYNTSLYWHEQFAQRGLKWSFKEVEKKYPKIDFHSCCLKEDHFGGKKRINLHNKNIVKLRPNARICSLKSGNRIDSFRFFRPENGTIPRLSQLPE